MIGFGLAIGMALSGGALAGEHPPIGFGQVNAQVYRGGRPATADNMAYLQHLGIRTIVNLQGSALQLFPGERPPAIAEGRALAQQFGLGFYNFPIPAGGRLSGDDQKLLLQVVSTLEDPRLAPLYVHCNVGADRTGMVVAAYRILHENCSFDQAKRELLHDGGFWSPILDGPQFDFLRALADHPEQYEQPRSAMQCSLP